MKQHVHLGDGPYGTSSLLTKKVRLSTVLAVLVDVVLCRDQHPARPAARIIDVVPKGGLQKSNHHANNRTRGVELTALFACTISELANQVFIRGTKKIWKFKVLVAQADFTEVVD